ncbi:MAG: flagellar biosynthesis protein FliQ [Lachnospiraceae bacterium]|nr:flagellar biosynthesis protein FliQ [Lachnospiraceae bacterium]
MNPEVVVQIISDGLFCVVKTAAPVLLVSLVVGLIISVFQTITSIQEQTLTFVPKLLLVFGTMMLLGNWMIDNIITFMENLWGNFSVYIR